MKYIKLLLFVLVGLTINGQEKEYKITYQSISWSPDSKQIFFTAIKVRPDWSDYDPNKWGLYIFDLETKSLKRMNFSAIFFSLSLDGTTLAFDKITTQNKGIFLYDLKTEQEANLVPEHLKAAGPSWSPEGDFIVFYGKSSGQEELYTFNIKTKETLQITNHESSKSFNPIWSPNSDFIVYYLETGDAKDQIWLTDSKGSFQKNLTNDDHHNIFPSWSQDGKILYVRDKGEVMSMNIDGSNKQKLIDGNYGLVSIDFTSSRLLLTNKDGNLYIFDIKEKSLEKAVDGNQLGE